MAHQSESPVVRAEAEVSCSILLKVKLWSRKRVHLRHKQSGQWLRHVYSVC